MTDTTTPTADVTYRAPEPLTADLLALYERVATEAASSNLFRADGNTSATKAQCLMVILYGHDLGLSPTASLQGINVFGDSMELSAGVLGGLIDRHPIYDYEVVACTDRLCTIRLLKHGVEFQTESFGIQDAQRAELLGSIFYQQYPDAMMFARCVSKLVRRHCPGVTSGIPVYVTGETRAGLKARDAALLSAGAPGSPAQAAPAQAAPAQAAPAQAAPAASANGQTAAEEPVVNQQQIDMVIDATRSAGLSAAQLFNVIASLSPRGRHEPDPEAAKQKLHRTWGRLPVSYVDKIIAALAEGRKGDPADMPAAAADEHGSDTATQPGSPAGEDVVTEGDIVRVRSEAAEHHITDGALVNVILRVTGRDAVADEAGAAAQLEQTLRTLPLRYLPTVFRTLAEMSAAATPQGELVAPAGTVRVSLDDMDPRAANGANGAGER